jgi:tetratricopeptide (TPR) repeat protein
MRSCCQCSAIRETLLGIILLLVCLPGVPVFAQDATVTETLQTFRTYPFSDPDPVARMGNIYPYFRFQGYSMTPIERQWKIVTLENRWIRVMIAPEIGGKVLGAIEKSTGRSFIYYNKVIKFREIAMRGPWTSGGIEYNFGDIGHTPTTATPVDYLTRTNADGSVSCIVGALDLPSRTEWRVEIRLPKDKAIFETRSYWYNPTPFTTSRYHWMNAAADADSTLQVIYPGTAFIGHAGEAGAWPVDRQGRDLTWYRNNAFGSYKSYHVLGAYTDFFGARWNDFGVIHWSRYTDKPGKKLWIWGLSREGEIWKGLLTDSALGNTQYVELQSGLHFNQAMMQSSRTPFKHMAFLPHTSERFTEAWFPFKGLDAVTQATPDGVLEVKRGAGKTVFGFCPTAAFVGKISVVAGGVRVNERSVNLQPLQSFNDSVSHAGSGDRLEIHIGDILQYRSSDDSLRSLERPIREETPFNWNSPNGLVADAQERVRQRDVDGAIASYRAALKADPALLPALSGLTELYIRRLEYDSALSCVKGGLAIDAYDPETNYLYGLVQRHRGRSFDAQDGFGIAAHSTSAYQAAALVQLAEMAYQDHQLSEAEYYAQQATDVDAALVAPLHLLTIIARSSGDSAAALRYLDQILALDPLNHGAGFERFRLAPTDANRRAFTGMIRNELPHESFMELAAYYLRIGRLDDARMLLSFSPRCAMVEFWQGYCAAKAGINDEAKQHLAVALAATPSLVYPHRLEDWDVLQWAHSNTSSWKIDYYLALLSWGLGRSHDAGSYFTTCGNEPDYAPFYLARGSFHATAPDLCLADYRRAVAVGPGEWRTYHALTSFLNIRGTYDEALQVSSKGIERFPQSYVLKFLHARTLFLDAQYRQSLSILDTLSILPSEGARFGREAYRQACVMTGLDTLRTRHDDIALGLLERAKLWPERLGAGRPYDVDNRVEDYLISRIMRRKGERTAADQLLGAINAYTMAHREGNTAQQLIGALALRESGRKAEARELLVRWSQREVGSALPRWAIAVLDGRRKEAEQLQRSLRQTTLNKFSGDQEAVLVAGVVAHMVNL